MSDKDKKVFKVIQLKGYKYRTKIIIAGIVIFAVIIALICFLIHGIYSVVTKKSDANNNVVSQTVDSSYETDTDIQVSASGAASSGDSASLNFDADGKLEIDTDTLDGQKAVAITFDDGPGEYTEELIEELNKRDAKATFFMLGIRIEQYPEAVRLMADGGHQLGNHTYNHVDITTLTEEELNEEISKTDEEIYNVCGQISTAFRPPNGSYSAEIINGIEKTVTIWSLDSEDWNLKDSEKIKDNIVSNCKDGDIILVHDIYKESVDGALAAIDELQGQGFVFVTVDELMSRYGYEVAQGKAHGSQYAVYETNSPDAENYASEYETTSSSPFYFSSAETSPESSSDSSPDESDSEFIY